MCLQTNVPVYSVLSGTNPEKALHTDVKFCKFQLEINVLIFYNFLITFNPRRRYKEHNGICIICVCLSFNSRCENQNWRKIEDKNCPGAVLCF